MFAKQGLRYYVLFHENTKEGSRPNTIKLYKPCNVKPPYQGSRDQDMNIYIYIYTCIHDNGIYRETDTTYTYVTQGVSQRDSSSTVWRFIDRCQMPRGGVGGSGEGDCGVNGVGGWRGDHEKTKKYIYIYIYI
jgi:hypothetical protein